MKTLTTDTAKVTKVRDNRAFLKVKLKSLAAEAKIIRKEEKKNPRLFLELRQHRIGIVRTEARATLLAYAFLRGRLYKQVEAKCHQGGNPDWTKVDAMVRKYGKSFDPEATHDQNAKNFSKLCSDFQNWKS